MLGFEIIQDKFNVYRISMYTDMNNDKYIQVET